MQAMSLHKPGQKLAASSSGPLKPGPGQVRIAVSACGVCRTDLHVVDGELTEPKLPIVPGHEIVGRILETGEGVSRFTIGTRVGVPWLGWTCGKPRP